MGSKKERTLKDDARLTDTFDELTKQLKQEGVITEASSRIKGRVLFFDKRKGWGLCESNNNNNNTYLIPRKELLPGYIPEAEDVITFRPGKHDTKPRAFKIQAVTN